MGVEPKRPSKDPYDNPARLSEKPSPRQLSIGDFEFIRNFDGADPKAVSGQSLT
jgi:hypothetical protein